MCGGVVAAPSWPSPARNLGHILSHVASATRQRQFQGTDVGDVGGGAMRGEGGGLCLNSTPEKCVVCSSLQSPMGRPEMSKANNSYKAAVRAVQEAGIFDSRAGLLGHEGQFEQCKKQVSKSPTSARSRSQEALLVQEAGLKEPSTLAKEPYFLQSRAPLQRSGSRLTCRLALPCRSLVALFRAGLLKQVSFDV